jgi:hypothetical protein
MAHTQEHAIQEWLGRFQGTWHPPGTEPSRMRPDTVRYVKRVRRMWFITCEADGGTRGNEHWSWTVETIRDDHGWRAHGVSGGSGPPLRRGRPWANLGGNWGRTGFRAGGRVEDAGANITRVRLTDRNGRMFEDRVESGVVLFSSGEPVAMPMRLDLVDADGRIVASEDWGFEDE